MRIGISAQLLRPEPTGVEVYIRGLIDALLNQDSSNTYFIYGHSNALADARLRHPNAVMRWIPFARTKPGRVIFEQGLLPNWLRRDRVDVFHAPAYVVPFWLPALRTVVTLPDIFALTAPSYCRWHNRLYYRWALPHAIRRSDRIITLSEVVRADILSHFSIEADKVKTIYPGVTPPDGAVERPRVPFILYVGNFDPKKNLRFLIHAFNRLKSVYAVPHKLRLAGKQSWAYRSIHEEAQRSPFQADIEFMDYVSDSEKWTLYKQASLFVFPSRFEGFGFPPVEAASCGVPVVLPDIPIFREILPGASFFKANHIHSCADQMEAQLQHPSTPRPDVSRFSFNNHARDCLNLYKELHEAD